jgi:hypothetical protein
VTNTGLVRDIYPADLAGALRRTPSCEGHASLWDPKVAMGSSSAGARQLIGSAVGEEGSFCRTSSHRWTLIVKPRDLTRYMPMLIQEFTG